VFPSIIWSWMSPTNNLSPVVQTTAGISSIVSLDSSNSVSHDLSSIFNVLPKLQSLWLECGSELQLSRDTTKILNALTTSNSKELKSTATSQVSDVKTSSLIERHGQVYESTTKHSMKSLLIQMGTSCLITNILKERIMQVSLSLSLSLLKWNPQMILNNQKRRKLRHSKCRKSSQYQYASRRVYL